MAAFLLDENLAPLLIGLLVQRGHQATTARAERLLGASDLEILERAAGRGLTLVTRDWRDFWNLHKGWRQSRPSQRHAGILAVEQVALKRFGELADAIAQLVESGTPLENEYHRWRSLHGWRHYAA